LSERSSQGEYGGRLSDGVKSDAGVTGTAAGSDLSAAPRRPLWRDLAAWVIALLALYELAYLAWWTSGLGDRELADALTGAVALPCGLVAIALALRMRASRRLDPRTRRAWTIVAAALACYGIGALIHFSGDRLEISAFLQPIYPVLEMGAYPLGALALMSVPKRSQARPGLILFALDALIVAWSSAIVIWHFVMYPIGIESGASILEIAAAAAFPVGDITFVFCLAAIMLRGVHPGSRTALSVLTLAFLLVFGGDLIAGVQSLRTQYEPGGLSGILYSGAWFALVIAAYAQSRADDRAQPISGRPGAVYRFVWLPYVAVLVAFVAPAIRSWNDIDLLREHVPATGLLIALVVFRLSVTAWQNAGLAAAGREHLAAAVEQAGEAIVMTDRLGNISYVNPAFTRITGYASKDVVGRDPIFLRRESLEVARRVEIETALARGDIWEGRLGDLRPDGSTIEIEAAIAPLRDPGGTVDGSVIVARDTTRERALEAQLVQAQRMEAIGRLAGGIAHDFNNILTAISGFGELAAAEVAKDDPVAADIDEIRKAADRAATLTRALLAFSRRQVLQPKVLDLNEVVSGVTPMLGRLIGEDVELVVRADKSLGCTMADGGQLEQVILNLAVNGRDAMPSGGRLTIETANVDLDEEYVRAHVGSAAGPHVMLAISDTGVGMTPEVLEHAFEPFYTTKEHGKGTGLGLSTVLGIVQQSGGSIHTYSEPGRGTIFKIYLPRVDAKPESETVEVRGASPRHGTETVLVAEDEEAVRLFVERVLEGAGYQVLTAANGQEAIDAARTLSHVDLLFTDMVMPGIGGPELAELLREIHPETRTLFASGYSEDAILRNAAGGSAGSPASYVAKPFTGDVLLSSVREALDKPVSDPVGA
jgi:PAS domain S-box-containing protein